MKPKPVCYIVSTKIKNSIENRPEHRMPDIFRDLMTSSIWGDVFAQLTEDLHSLKTK